MNDQPQETDVDAEIESIDVAAELRSDPLKKERVLAQLSPVDSVIIVRRVLSVEEHHTLKSVGEEIGLSKDRVRQRQSRAMEKIKRVLLAEKYSEKFENAGRDPSLLAEIPIDALLLSRTSRRTIGWWRYNNLLELSRVPLCDLRAEQTREEVQEKLKKFGVELQANRPHVDLAALKGAPDRLNHPIETLPFSVRARTCLRERGCETLYHVTRLSAPELLEMKNFGVTTLHNVRCVLSQLGLKLWDD